MAVARRARVAGMPFLPFKRLKRCQVEEGFHIGVVVKYSLCVPDTRKFYIDKLQPLQVGTVQDASAGYTWLTLHRATR